MQNRFLLGCLILSGFAGLAYELLWVRLLALSFGSTASSFSTVLAVFFGGLAIGSLIGGRIAKRVVRPVRAYAMLELGTGLAALVLYPILVGLESTFAQFDPGPGTLGTLLRFIVSASVLILPTILMGATLPFVTRAMVARDEDVGRATALIYAFNTFGACLGAYVTTFWSLPYLGVLWSTLATVGINLVVFAAAVGLGRNERPLRAESGAAATAVGREDDDTKLKVVGGGLAGILGFAAVALQVVWVRIFSTAMEGTVYGTGSVLIAVLVGIGVGSLVLAPFLKRSPRAGLAFIGLQVLGLALVLVQFKLLPWISYELGAIQIQRLSTFGLHLQMLIVIAAVLGPSVCSGASLPLIIGIVEARASRSARTVGNVYAANTIGAIIGSLLTGFVVLPDAGSEAAVLLAVIALGGAAAFGALFLFDGPRPVRLALVPLGLLLTATYGGYDVQALATGPSKGAFTDWWRVAEARKKATLMFSEAKSSNVRVTASDDSRSLTLNSLGQGGRMNSPPHHIVESLMMAVIPLAHAPRAERSLLVGLGAGVTVDAMLELGVEQIRVVELEPKVVEAVKVIFQEKDPLASQRVDIVIDDARHFLNAHRGSDDAKYDIIASMPAHPWIASPIFTREFFEIVKDNLTPTGVFCSWFGLGKMDSHATDSLLRAFTTVFEHFVVYFVPSNGAYFLVGSPSPVEVSPRKYQALFEHPTLRPHRQFSDPLYLARQIVATGRGQSGALVRPGPINTDDRPIVEMLSPVTTPTVGTASPDLFAERGLDPMLVPKAERLDFMAALLEDMLATPNGRLPYRPRKVDLPAARTALSRSADLFDPGTRDYFEVRLEIAKDPLADDLDGRINALARPEHQNRARRARAWSLPKHSAPRAQAFAGLPPDTDVIFHEVFEAGPLALGRLRPDRPDVDDDPIGWWMWHLADPTRLDDSVRARVITTVGPKLAAAGNEHLFAQTAEVTSAAGWTEVARVATEWAQATRRARVAYHRRQGVMAGRKRQFAKAADHLWQAFELAPLTVRLRKPLIRSLVSINDQDRLQKVSSSLRFQGLSRAQITFMIQQATRNHRTGDRPDLSVNDMSPQPPVQTAGSPQVPAGL